MYLRSYKILIAIIGLFFILILFSQSFRNLITGPFTYKQNGQLTGNVVSIPKTLPPPTPPTDTTPPTVSITAPTANQTLSTGATSTTLSVTTNESATCKYDTTDQSYSSMTNTFTITGGTSHSTTITGLQDGTSYTKYVRCQDTTGNPNTTSTSVSFSVASFVATSSQTLPPPTSPADTTPPTVPTGLTATPISSSQINLSWTASTDNIGVAGYKIYRNNTQIATSTVTSYSDTNLTAAATYSYTVSAYDAVGNSSAQSSALNATTQSQVQSQVTPVFQDDFEGNTVNSYPSYVAQNGYSWSPGQGSSATPGTGYNGSFVRSSGTWVPDTMIGVQANFYDDSWKAYGPFSVTGNNETTLYFTGNVTGATNLAESRPRVSSSVVRTGNKSLDFPFRPTNSTGAAFSEQRFSLGSYLTELWIEYYIYIPANFKLRTVGGGIFDGGVNYNNKWFILWRDDYQSQLDNTVGFEYTRRLVGNKTDGYAALRPYSSTSTSGAILDIRTANADIGPPSNFISPNSTMKIGDWNRMRIHVKQASAALANDGIIEMFVGDTPVLRVNDRDLYPIGGVNYSGFKNGYILGYANTGYDNLTEFYVDDFKIYDKNPGWTTSSNTISNTTPPPPTPIAGDLNLDHIVNSLDWSIMNAKWFTNDTTADINHDGIVNSIDFSILNNNWFKTW